MKKMNRKETLERIHVKIGKLRAYGSSKAWEHLMLSVFVLSDPSRHGGPKFKDLLLAIFKAGIYGKLKEKRRENQ